MVSKVVEGLDVGKPMLVAILCAVGVVMLAAAYNDFNPDYEPKIAVATVKAN
jgi:hypothetical protein